MQYSSIAHENCFTCELSTAAFIWGKLFTHTHSTLILESGPSSPRHDTGAECNNSTFMDCLLHSAGQQDCQRETTHDDDPEKKNLILNKTVIYRV